MLISNKMFLLYYFLISISIEIIVLKYYFILNIEKSSERRNGYLVTGNIFLSFRKL